MKKFGIIALFALISVAASAQINVGAGYLQSTATYQAKSGADVNSTKSNGFYVGLGYEIPLMQGLSVTPGIYYS